MDVLRSRVATAFRKAKAQVGVATGTKEVYELKNQKKMYDAKFVEEQHGYQKIPKKRGQTLQEFVLLFFYISLAIFTVAMMIYAFLEKQSYSSALGALIVCAGIALVITAILIRAG
jgi:ammonia channel protein AmtB